jgi:hypothetical protein
MVFSKSGFFNANAAKEAKTRIFKPFREIRPIGVIRVEPAPQNPEIVKRP